MLARYTRLKDAVSGFARNRRGNVGVIVAGSDCTIVVADSFIFAGTPTFHAQGTCINDPDLIDDPSKASLVN